MKNQYGDGGAEGGGGYCVVPSFTEFYRVFYRVVPSCSLSIRLLDFQITGSFHKINCLTKLMAFYRVFLLMRFVTEDSVWRVSYLVLPSFTEFYRVFYRVVPSCSLSIRLLDFQITGSFHKINCLTKLMAFYRVFLLMRFVTEDSVWRVSYLVLPSFTGFYRVLQGFTGFYRVLPSLIGFYRVLPSFTEFNRVLLGFTEFYRV